MSGIYTSSRGPRCSDIATSNQTPTRGRRVLLLRLAKKERKEDIMWRSRARARGAGNPRPPLRPSPGAGNPRPHSPTLREGGGAGRVRLTQRQQLRYEAPRQGGGGGLLELPRVGWLAWAETARMVPRAVGPKLPPQASNTRSRNWMP